MNRLVNGGLQPSQLRLRRRERWRAEQPVAADGGRHEPPRMSPQLGPRRHDHRSD
jgi:hypothetical protein